MVLGWDPQMSRLKQVLIYLNTSSLGVITFYKTFFIYALVGWKMWCEVILPRNKIKGEITARYIYQTLSIDAKILVALGVPSVQLFTILMLTSQIKILIIKQWKDESSDDFQSKDATKP